MDKCVYLFLQYVFLVLKNLVLVWKHLFSAEDASIAGIFGWFLRFQTIIVASQHIISEDIIGQIDVKSTERKRERAKERRCIRHIMRCHKRRVSRVSSFQQSDLRVVHGARCSSINFAAYTPQSSNSAKYIPCQFAWNTLGRARAKSESCDVGRYSLTDLRGQTQL